MAVIPSSWTPGEAAPAPRSDPESPQPSPTAATPPRWAAALVAVVLVTAAVLVGFGTPTGVVLEVLGGAGYIGTEVVHRLTGA